MDKPDKTAAAPLPPPSETEPTVQPERLVVAEILSNLRRERKWTLADVARRTRVSVSTLSKIENGQTAPAYSVLVRLSEGLDIDLGGLIGGVPARPVTGARAVTRKGEGPRYDNAMGHYEALATDLAAKYIEPMIVEIPPDGREPGRIRSEHEGDEFVYVLSGEVLFEMDPYAPLNLSAGDSVYFDGRASHGFSAQGSEPARILSICQVRPSVPR